MITFLPRPSYLQSARDLDRARLGKQRIEVTAILRTLKEKDGPWLNHPAIRMWRGHEQSLIRYGLEICDEWRSRGYKDSIRDQLLALWLPGDPPKPEWFGRPDVHRSHRANLVRKFPEHYVPIYGEIPPEPYVWPV